MGAPKKPLTGDEQRQIRELYSVKGLNVDQTAKAVGRARDHVRAYLKDQGLTRTTGAIREHDHTGKQFDRWTVIEKAPKPPHVVSRQTHWLCQCICGNQGIVSSGNLLTGQSRSCGCLQPEQAAKHSGDCNVERWVDGTFKFPERSSYFYIYELKNYRGFCKPGIALDIKQRRGQGHGQYGELFDYIELPRIDAWLLEQAVLHQTSADAFCPLELELARWGGYTEVRRLEAVKVFSLAIQLHEQLQALGRFRFALQFLDLTSEARDAINRQAAAAIENS